jgi:hypothetical protein
VLVGQALMTGHAVSPSTRPFKVLTENTEALIQYSK